jgi:hypothetical protein
MKKKEAVVEEDWEKYSEDSVDCMDGPAKADEREKQVKT